MARLSGVRALRLSTTTSAPSACCADECLGADELYSMTTSCGLASEDVLTTSCVQCAGLEVADVTSDAGDFVGFAPAPMGDGSLARAV